MKNQRYRIVMTAACFATLLAGVTAHGSQKTVRGHSYQAVNAILKARCLSCHNDRRHPEAVNLSSYAKLMKSGEKGPIVIAGHPEKSKLLLYVSGAKQPRMPMGKPPLTKREITTIRNWIKAGAHN